MDAQTFAIHNLNAEFTVLRQHLQNEKQAGQMATSEVDSTIEILAYLQAIYSYDPTQVDSVKKALDLLKEDIAKRIDPLTRATETDALIQGALDLMQFSGASQEEISKSEAVGDAVVGLLRLQDPALAEVRQASQ